MSTGDGAILAMSTVFAHNLLRKIKSVAFFQVHTPPSRWDPTPRVTTPLGARWEPADPRLAACFC